MIVRHFSSKLSFVTIRPTTEKLPRLKKESDAKQSGVVQGRGFATPTWKAEVIYVYLRRKNIASIKKISARPIHLMITFFLFKKESSCKMLRARWRRAKRGY